jgi:hypothetical protein
MKKVLVIMFVAVFAACSGEKKVEKPFNSTVFIEQKIYEYLEANKNWDVKENDAEATDKFKRQAIKWSNEPDFLKEMPLQLINIKDTTISEQAVKVAVFKSFMDADRTNTTLLNIIQLEINGIFSVDEAKDLQINKKYTLKGMLYKQGKRADVNFIENGEPGLFNIGKYTFWNIEAKAL